MATYPCCTPWPKQRTKLLSAQSAASTLVWMADAAPSIAADDPRLQQCAFAKLVGPEVRRAGLGGGDGSLSLHVLGCNASASFMPCTQHTQCCDCHVDGMPCWFRALRRPCNLQKYVCKRCLVDATPSCPASFNTNQHKISTHNDLCTCSMPGWRGLHPAVRGDPGAAQRQAAGGHRAGRQQEPVAQDGGHMLQL